MFGKLFRTWLKSSDRLRDPKPKNPMGKPNIFGHSNPTQTRKGNTQTQPETQHTKPEGFSGSKI